MTRERTAHVVLLTCLLAACLCAGAAAATRTDVVVLANGDRITGEILTLDRGQLEFKTDDAGTLYIEWDDIRRLEAVRLFEVGLTDGRRFVGSLAPATDGTLIVAGLGPPLSFPMGEVTLIVVQGTNFWKRLEGSIDLGFSYTKSSGVAQLNVNSDTLYRRPRFDASLAMSLTATRQQDGEEDDRGSIEAAYLRHRWPRWFVGGIARFESNRSLGLRLRSQVSGITGPRLVNSNRAQVLAGGGLVVSDERGVDATATRNLEGLLMIQTSYFTYDRPRSDLTSSLTYYPSLSNAGRHRLQLDASLRQELLRNLFVGLNVYDSFDSRPPNPDFDVNDVGITFSIGWSY